MATISFIGDRTQSNMLQNHNTSRPVDTSTMLVPLYSILWHQLSFTRKHTLPARLSLNHYLANGYTESRKCSKSDYVIEGGLIWAWNHCLSSDTRVVCLRRTVPLVPEVPSLNPGGTPLCWFLPLWGDSLDTRKRGVRLGLGSKYNKLKYLFTKAGFNFDTQQIFNPHIFYNLVVIKFRILGLFLNLHSNAHKLKMLMISCPTLPLPFYLPDPNHHQ